MADTAYKYLGTKATMEERDLDTIPSPPNAEVQFVTDELYSHCPITGHPDFNTATIRYEPGEYGIESKSLKYYIESFKDEGMFCEALADLIAQDIFDAIEPLWVEVTVEQSIRGGLRLTATSRRQA